jgi:hypothetical protein
MILPMKLADFSQSLVGKIVIGFALFAAGWYFPIFRLGGSPKAPAAQATASTAAAGMAGSQPQR